MIKNTQVPPAKEKTFTAYPPEELVDPECRAMWMRLDACLERLKSAHPPYQRLPVGAHELVQIADGICEPVRQSHRSDDQPSQ